jgi:hypothetical protein
MNQLFARSSTLAFATAALAVSTAVLPPAAQAQGMNCTYTAGAGGAFNLQCTPSLSCTIAATPSANAQPGSAIALTANCPAASGKQTYLWSLVSGPGNCPATSATSQTVSNLVATDVTSSACNYQVVVTDGTKGGSPTIAVSWTTTPPAAPTGCTLALATTPSPLTTAAFTATPTVTCATPPASSLVYSWTKNGAAWTAATAANPTDSEVANTGTAALTYTYTPTICNGPSQGSNCVTLSGVTASQPGTGGGGGGGGGQYNCHAINPSLISGNTTTINENWATPGVNVAAPMGVHDAIVIAFTTGPNANGSASFSRITGAEWNGSAQTTRLAVLSSQPCDFGTGVGGPYAVSNNSSYTFYFNVGQPSPYNFPVLRPNTQYFVNIMNGSNPSCASNGNCEMFTSLLKGSGL